MLLVIKPIENRTPLIEVDEKLDLIIKTHNLNTIRKIDELPSTNNICWKMHDIINSMCRKYNLSFKNFEQGETLYAIRERFNTFIRVVNLYNIQLWDDDRVFNGD